MKKNIIVESEYDRGQLTEGRDFQLGFAFGRKDSETHYTLCQALSACKDYLNDVVLAEQFGYSFSIYGYHCKKQGAFDNGVHLFFSILKSSRNTSKYTTQCQVVDRRVLRKNYKLMQTALNRFEKELQLDQLTVIEKIGPNMYIAHISPYWVQNPYYISLYSLLLRSFLRVQDYTDTDIVKTYMTIGPHETMNGPMEINMIDDLSLLKHSIAIILYLRKHRVLPQYTPAITLEEFEKKPLMTVYGDVLPLYRLHGNGIIHCKNAYADLFSEYQPLVNEYLALNKYTKSLTDF